MQKTKKRTIRYAIPEKQERLERETLKVQGVQSRDLAEKSSCECLRAPEAKETVSRFNG